MTLFFLVVEGDRAVSHEEMQAVEDAAPAVERVAAAGDEAGMLVWPAGCDHHPLEVLLAPEVTGIRRRGARFGGVEAGVGRLVQHPAVHVGVPGIEYEVGGIDPVVVVGAPVRLPGVQLPQLKLTPSRRRRGRRWPWRWAGLPSRPWLGPIHDVPPWKNSANAWRGLNSRSVTPRAGEPAVAASSDSPRACPAGPLPPTPLLPLSPWSNGRTSRGDRIVSGTSAPILAVAL